MAWPFSTRKQREALTASVSVVPHSKNSPLGGGFGAKKQSDRAWQADAWLFYHDLGEVRFCARYIGNALSRCRFYVGTRDHPGDPVTPISDADKAEDKKYRDLLTRVRGRDGTFTSLIQVYGIQQFVAGESFLVAEDGLDGERWEFLSTSELRRLSRNQGTKQIVTEQVPEYARIHPDGSEVEITDNSVVLRFWNRDPEFRERADSPLRPVLDICEALHTAQAMQTAGDRSRLATAGLLLVPAEADLPKTPLTDNAGGLSQPQRLMLLDELLEAMTTAMTDPGSVVSLVPIIVEARSDIIDKFVHLNFNREIDATIVPRIDHLIRRLAQGLDIPPEKLLGQGEINHWSSWQVSEETVSAHVAPMAASFCEDLTVGFLRPTLAAMGVKDLDRYAIGFDPSELIVSPNRADHGFMLWDRDMIKGDAAIRAAGFDPEEKPDMSEIIQKILIERAKNPHNPDPGADIAALLGQQPPPTGAEKNVIGVDPTQQPAHNPQVPEQDPKAQGRPPNGGAKPAQADSQDAKDAQRRGTPATRPGTTVPAPNGGVNAKPSTSGAGKKGARGIKKTAVIDQMVLACDEAVREISEGRSELAARTLLRDKLILFTDEQAAVLVVDGVVRAHKYGRSAAEVSEIAAVLCETAVMDHGYVP